MKALQGFTLIELLVVLTIIGALTAVAVPQYASYKKRAFDTLAQTDLRNVALAEEAYFIDYDSYLSCVDSGCTDLPGIMKLSKGVTLEINATESGFTGSSKHLKGSKTFEWDSSLGGFQY